MKVKMKRKSEVKVGKDMVCGVMGSFDIVNLCPPPQL